jgi:hypothetical protein
MFSSKNNSLELFPSSPLMPFPILSIDVFFSLKASLDS